jgi:hypothetical protein
MAQTSVSLTSYGSSLGMLADTGVKDVETVYSDADLPFALGVLLDSSADENGRTRVKLPAGDVDNFMGVVLHSHLIERVAGADLEHAAEAAVPVLRKGKVWIVAEQDVAAADTVFLRHTLNGALTPGGFRKDNDGGNALEVAAKFRSSAAAGNPVLLEVNLP